MKTREYQYDNLRFLLIALVVLGHLLEVASTFPHKQVIYTVIYSFHMPAFLFLSGMFARFDRVKWLFGLCLPYLALQSLYIFFARQMYGPGLPLQFSQPYWLLWYLFALAVYTLMLPVYDLSSPGGRAAMTAAAFLLAVLAGFDQSIGYPWSASRILVFQPWFLLGFYAGRRGRAGQPPKERSRGFLLGTALLTAGTCLVLEYLLVRSGVPGQVLYGAQSYQAAGGSWEWRVLSMACAGSVILLLFGVAARGLRLRIPVLTTLGQNTLSIYLFHGFVVRFIQNRCSSLLSGPLAVLAVWAAILLLLGNPAVGRCTGFLLGAGWYRRLKTKKDGTASPREPG